MGELYRIAIGEEPQTPISFIFGLAGALCDFPRSCMLFVCVLLFAHSPEVLSMRRYIMLLYSRFHQRDDASRLRRVEISRILLLFWRLGLRRRPLALSLLPAI